MIRSRGIRSLAVLVAVWPLVGCPASGQGRSLEEPMSLVARVVRELPHDPGAFTQGLVWFDGSLYESTGIAGESELRQVDPESGAVLRRVALQEDLFGEGLALVGDRLWQLTWQNGVALEYALESFELVARHTLEGEGWGLCSDGTEFWMSDGSARLQRRSTTDFSLVGQLPVSLRGRAQAYLNELECAEGWIYANVYGSDAIVRIDPLTGAVVAVIDARGLLKSEERQRLAAGEVLNGIAYDPERGSFYVTGKRWPKLFEVVFVEP